MLLETERLFIRDLALEDAEALFSIYQNEDVMRFQGGVPSSLVAEREAIKSHIEKYYKKNGFGLWAVVLKETNTVIGRTGLLLSEIEGKRRTEISYLIGREYWGQGLAKEASSAVINYAFENLKIEKIFACIEPLNISSLRVAEKLQMSNIGESLYKGKNVRLYVKGN